jgi:hypothetical protein
MQILEQSSVLCNQQLPNSSWKDKTASGGSREVMGVLTHEDAHFDRNPTCALL